MWKLRLDENITKSSRAWTTTIEIEIGHMSVFSIWRLTNEIYKICIDISHLHTSTENADTSVHIRTIISNEKTLLQDVLVILGESFKIARNIFLAQFFLLYCYYGILNVFTARIQRLPSVCNTFSHSVVIVLSYHIKYYMITQYTYNWMTECVTYITRLKIIAKYRQFFLCSVLPMKHFTIPTLLSVTRKYFVKIFAWFNSENILWCSWTYYMHHFDVAMKKYLIMIN